MSHDESYRSRRLVTRRAAIQLGAGAGAAALAAPYLGRMGGGRDAFDLGDAQRVLSQNPTWPVPPMITRAGWGANEGLRKPGQIYDPSIEKIIVHHTGTPNDITDYAGLARGILADETAGEYIDIAYNWLIDPNGNIYEGRWAQDYPPGIPHTGERNGANVRGGHAIYHNSRTVGVALMGNYDIADPSAAMIESLVNFLAWKCARWGLDPRASGTYSASNGAVENLFNICGHRDTSATACPGIRVESMLPALRRARRGTDVRRRLLDRVPSGARARVRRCTGRQRRVRAHDRGNRRSSRRSRLLALRTGRLGAHLRKGADSTAGCAGSGSRHRSSGWRPGRPATATGSLPQMGACSPSAPPTSTARREGCASMPPCSAWCRRRSGNGYWLYAQDGGVFSFGDAGFHGSTGGMRLDQPVVSMARRPKGGGYWLVAADGGVFAFGKAEFHGSAAIYPSFSPCVGMLPTTTGRGYVLLRGDGSVWAFGDAPYLGGANGVFHSSAIGIAGRLKPF